MPRSFFSRFLIHVGLFLVWAVLHIPLLWYATDNLPLHTAYVGDEQSPINGALHILNERSLLAVHNLETLYYGPLFAVVALPAVLLDAAHYVLKEGSINSQGYLNYLMYDWGGIVFFARLIALLASYIGLVGVYRLFMTKVVNPSQIRWLAMVGVLLVGSNFYFFTYGAVFRHWIFIMTFLIWQLYLLASPSQDGLRGRPRWWLWHAVLGAAAFGFSYVGILSQAILIPALWQCLKSRVKLKEALVYYAAPLAAMCSVIVWWHPYAFTRILAFFTEGVVSSESDSFYLYNEQVLTVNKLQYYGEIVIINHIFLLVAGVLVLLLARRLLVGLLGQLILAASLVGTLYFALFSSFEIAESRYASVTVLMLTIVAATVLISQWSYLVRWQRLVVALLVIGHFAYHLLALAGWSVLTWAGPVERQFIPQLTAFPAGELVTTNDRLVGWPHATSSIASYVAVAGRQEYSLFKAYAQSIPPNDVPTLNMQYLGENDPLPDSWVFSCVNPVKLGQVPFDYPELRLYRFWSGDDSWKVTCDLKFNNISTTE